MMGERRLNMFRRTVLFAFILTCFWANSVMAQISVTPPEVAAKIREMGKDLSPEIIGASMKRYV